uniref:Uncharacterized protein n=1 Tax=Phakopsora pachyrhizi TaxID=170000 RepID=A0A0S1MJG2_PHAPC
MTLFSTFTLIPSYHTHLALLLTFSAFFAISALPLAPTDYFKIYFSIRRAIFSASALSCCNSLDSSKRLQAYFFKLSFITFSQKKKEHVEIPYFRLQL